MALEPAKLSDFIMAGALGAGATAQVYGAVHAATGLPVAIKVMGSESASSAELRERFAREALLLAGVESRHVAKILGFGFDTGHPFLVLERLEGETLDAKLRRDGPIPAPLAARWIEELLIGVRDCHHANVIHRDIKPSNIFMHRDGLGEAVKLIDFGVARLREGASGTGLTSASHLIGSMGYMAPEQFDNPMTVGFPSDLYAVGVVVFRAFTGRLPFISRSVEDAIRKKTEEPVPAVSSMSPVASVALDGFVQKAMARRPEDRFQSAREMLERWWSVMASLPAEDDGTAHGSREGRLLAEAPSSSPPSSLPATARHGRAPDTEEEDEEESTVRRPVVDAEALRALARDEAPYTVRQDDPEAWQPGDDPFELPTLTNPNLRELVARELELHRSKKDRDGT